MFRDTLKFLALVIQPRPVRRFLSPSTSIYHSEVILHTSIRIRTILLL